MRECSSATLLFHAFRSRVEASLEPHDVSLLGHTGHRTYGWIHLDHGKPQLQCHARYDPIDALVIGFTSAIVTTFAHIFAATFGAHAVTIEPLIV